jgi:hypothetical protein
LRSERDSVSAILKFFLEIAVVVLCLLPVCRAQSGSGTKSWSSTSQQVDTGGTLNPTRTTETHSESPGHSVDTTLVETLGPDGRYIPFSRTEKEVVQADPTTVRKVERTFGTGPDGQKVLIQEAREESRSFADGESKVVRTISDPDANGALQLIRRELVDSKQVSSGVRQTDTSIFSTDANSGMSPVVQVHEREKRASDGTTEFSKSTELSDGAGHWTVSEVREGKIKPDGTQGSTKEENVLRPDSDGRLAVVERTVTKLASGAGEERAVTETYSTNVAGQAGNEGLHLVQRASSVQRSNSAGGQNTIRQVESPSAGNPADGLRVTQQAIDIVRPAGAASAEQRSTIVNFGVDGQPGTTLVDVGKTSNPAAISVDTSSGAKRK